MLHVHDFIMELPQGYASNVGERGSGLSGGQRQRIAIARAVLQRPNLLILDEATSALDYLTERQVCLNLKKAFEGSTVFFITHRLSTIRSADRILMMDSGALVEEGTHQELLQQQGRYFALYSQQEADLTDNDQYHHENNKLFSVVIWEGSSALWTRTPLVFSTHLALFGVVWRHLDLGFHRQDRSNCHSAGSSRTLRVCSRS